MLEYVEKLTVNPGGVTKQDMEHLIAAGFSVRDFYDIVVLTSAFNFITRVADAFGVHLDDTINGFLTALGEEAVFDPKA